jgi:hypothetical protein
MKRVLLLLFAVTDVFGKTIINTEYEDVSMSKEKASTSTMQGRPPVEYLRVSPIIYSAVNNESSDEVEIMSHWSASEKGAQGYLACI